MAKTLDDCHCKTLDDCLRECAAIQEEIEKNKRAGLDMSAAEEQNKVHAQVAAGIKREHFPNRP